MGMYDSVIAKCPHCHSSVEFQSKADVCHLRRFTPREVPVSIADDLDGQEVKCECCNKMVTIKYPLRAPRYVPMDVYLSEHLKCDEEET